MVRHNYSEEDIINFIRKGWNFRVRPRKGRRYIFRRKKQVERSLGPYSDELWDTITRLREQAPHFPGIVSEKMKEQEWASKLLDERLNLERSVYMMMNCVHKDSEGNCTSWSWSGKPGFYEDAEKIFRAEDIKSVGTRSQPKWIARASPWFCKHCPIFKEA